MPVFISIGCRPADTKLLILEERRGDIRKPHLSERLRHVVAYIHQKIPAYDQVTYQLQIILTASAAAQRLHL